LKILAKEDPASFAKLAVGVLPREFEGLPPAVQIITGVVRGDEGPAVAVPSPPVALPPPKKEEPKAEACPLMTADLVAPLPKASDITEAQPAVEKPAFNRWLHYIDDGWR
jgi:hypothetical protein